MLEDNIKIGLKAKRWKLLSAKELQTNVAQQPGKVRI
jgi:hypothetical protein